LSLLGKYLKKAKSSALTKEEEEEFWDEVDKFLNEPYIPPPRFGKNDYFWDEVIFLPEGYELSDLPFYNARVFVEDSNYGNRVEFVDDTYPQDYGVLLTLQETILREIPVKVYPTTDPNLIFYFTIHGGKVI